MKIMSRLIEVITYAVCGVLMFGSVVWSIKTLNGWRTDAPAYNCSIAEISPDFTPAMRETCRKLRREQQ